MYGIVSLKAGWRIDWLKHCGEKIVKKTKNNTLNVEVFHLVSQVKKFSLAISLFSMLMFFFYIFILRIGVVRFSTM